MKLYKYQFSSITPHNERFRYPGKIRTQKDTYFESRELFYKKLQEWTKKGWTYFESIKDKEYNNSLESEYVVEVEYSKNIAWTNTNDMLLVKEL